MKYLNSYKLFESKNDRVSLRDEVKDLLANLEDDGFMVTFSYMGNDKGYIYIKIPGAFSDYGYGKTYTRFFDIDEVRGDIIRLCDFLGDRYLCDINIVGSDKNILNRNKSISSQTLGKEKKITLDLFKEIDLKGIYSIKINLFSKKDD